MSCGLAHGRAQGTRLAAGAVDDGCTAVIAASALIRIENSGFTDDRASASEGGHFVIPGSGHNVYPLSRPEICASQLAVPVRGRRNLRAFSLDSSLSGTGRPPRQSCRALGSSAIDTEHPTIPPVTRRSAPARHEHGRRGGGHRGAEYRGSDPGRYASCLGPRRRRWTSFASTPESVAMERRRCAFAEQLILRLVSDRMV